MHHRLHKDYNISFLSSFKNEAYARYFYDVKDRNDMEDLREIHEFAKTEGIPVLLLGGGTNCLFAFDMYEGIIVRNHFTGYSEPFDQNGKTLVHVHSGEQVTPFANSLFQHYTIGTLIPWIGLPGTMGGAVAGNAGCFGLEMKDILVEVELLDLVTGKFVTYTAEDLKYEYRSSIIKGDSRYFVVDVLLDVSPLKDNEYSKYTPSEFQVIRRLKQPPGLSCGSFFKNPPANSAGKLIDEAGLKGYRIGGVKVSEVHANFFINDQKGSYQDILALSEHVKKTVFDKTGIMLHEEVRIIANDR